MLVCHKWHANASHATESLWTDIDFERQRTLAPVLLTRSSGASIHLCGSITSEDNTFETIVKDNGERIRGLDAVWVEGTMSEALQAILSVDMPRVRILSLSREDTDAAPATTVLTSALASFPSLEAMLLKSFLFTLSHILPRLTHLHLAQMEQLDASNLLDLLRNTPVLEVLNIISSRLIVPLNSTTASSPVSLPRLVNAHISRSTSAVVHYLMAALDIPSLALLNLSKVYVTGELSMPLFPHALAAHPMHRLAFDVDCDFVSFNTKLHGSGVSLAIGLDAHELPDSEWTRWAFTTFPTTLPLSGIEEFHIQAHRWGAPRDVLPRLAAYMPAVSTLLVRHDPGDEDHEDAEGHMGLARAVARVLTSESPVFFPHLAYLEVIVSSIPLAFCRTLARALARRVESGRRLYKFRIRIDDEYLFQWQLKWMGRREPDYRKTGIVDHVDECEISGDFMDSGGDDEERLGWGEWSDCVQRATHEYWQE